MESILRKLKMTSGAKFLVSDWGIYDDDTYDDTTGLGKGKNLRDLTQYMNCELQKIANWFRSNKMAINTAKTKFIVFRTRGKRVDPNDCILIFNNNEIGKPENLIFYFPLPECTMTVSKKISSC
jgi:hypothetical protein